MKKVLSLNQVLEKTYKKVYKSVKKRRNICFGRKISNVISDDSDYQSTRRGYIQYSSGRLLDFGNKKILVSLGSGSHVYSSLEIFDIAAFNVSEAKLNEINYSSQKEYYKSVSELRKELEKIFQYNKYFRNSLMHVDMDEISYYEELVISNNSDWKGIEKLIEENIELNKFIKKEVESNKDIVFSVKGYKKQYSKEHKKMRKEVQKKVPKLLSEIILKYLKQ